MISALFLSETSSLPLGKSPPSWCRFCLGGSRKQDTLQTLPPVGSTSRTFASCYQLADWLKTEQRSGRAPLSPSKTRPSAGRSLLWNPWTRLAKNGITVRLPPRTSFFPVYCRIATSIATSYKKISLVFNFTSCKYERTYLFVKYKENNCQHNNTAPSYLWVVFFG